MVKRKVKISIFFFLGKQTERERERCNWTMGRRRGLVVGDEIVDHRASTSRRREMSSDHRIFWDELRFWGLCERVFYVWTVNENGFRFCIFHFDFISRFENFGGYLLSRVVTELPWKMFKLWRENSRGRVKCFFVFLKLMSGCIRFILRVLVIVSPHFSKPSKKVSQKRLSFWANFVPSIWSLIITLRHIRIQ